MTFFSKIMILIKGRYREQKIWEKDKTPWQRAKVHFGVKWRRFQTQTHGFGFVLVLMMALIMVTPLINTITAAIKQYQFSTKYHNALLSSCKYRDFYNLNWSDCEDAGIRPDSTRLSNPQVIS